MSFLHVIGFGLKVGHLLLVLCCWIVSIIYINWFISMDKKMGFLGDGGKMWLKWWEKILGITEKRKETLASMCDERARMLQDQFNVSMNHIQAMSILISTFHHAKNPSAIDQRTFAKYTERTAFERPLTSGVAYAVRVLQSEREQFEKQQGWSIKRMDTMEQNPVHEDDYVPDELERSPIHEEYAPVIFAQDTISHVISIDVLSGKEDRENVLRARESGKGVLTAPFRLLKTNRLGVILTFAVYRRDLPSNATPNERIQATDGYLGGVFEIESLVEKLLQQLASKQTVIVSVYDTTNHTHSIPMYGSDVSGDEFYHVSFLNFGDPFRKHEMHCRFKQKPPWPWLALSTSFGILVIALLVGHICHATVNRIATIEEDCRKMTELKKLAEAADVAKSQFLATVSHEIRTPMNGVLGMMNMIMDTDLDVTQQEYVRTAQGSGKALVSIINELLDQAKIDSGKLELDALMFDIRAIMDDVLSLFSEKSQGKGVELAVYVSDQVPQQLIGDPGRFRQIITNLMGNSVKFTDKGHIFVTIHLVEEVFHSIEVERESSKETDDTLSGFPVADGRRSWEGFKAFSHEGPLGSFSSPSSTDLINVIVSVEDTGEGIPLESQEKIFTPFMQGEIGFASEPGIGSTFTFTAGFTNACPDSNEIKTQKISNQPHPASSEFNGMAALVIDPRPVRAKVSRYHIQRLGIHVETKLDLKQGLSTVTDGNVAINMVLIEQEVWERDTSISSQFVNNIRKIVEVDKEIPPKLFILVNSTSSFRVSSSVTSCVHNPTVVTKPLRASMLAASLQRAMGVGNKGNPRNGEHQGLSLHHLLSGRKILIVDDNSVNRTVAAGALKKYGAGVVCVSSGKEAISMLKPPHQFDACFMDIQMPEMDGFEATQRIRKIENNVSNQELYVHLPILAMTADVMQATQEECLKYGMDGYVSKPFEAEQLYREVSKFLQSS
ncbi:unnamed protein product [Vicia faba]|uniref:histidine kinase n=1 Tax=Vicia faba TaxID=3906 RepID=A0AAV0ZLS9_VICFA|nr:unnamed protein product [Vicia faba]